jgi:rhomboid-like protein
VKDLKQGRLKNTLNYMHEPITFNFVERFCGAARVEQIFAEPRMGIMGRGISVLTSPIEAWQNFSGPSKFIATTVGLNTGLFALAHLSPSVWVKLAHLPSGPLNYTLLTSMFGHSGLAHLGLNMYALTQFGADLSLSKTIQGSGSHCMSTLLCLPSTLARILRE